MARMTRLYRLVTALLLAALVAACGTDSSSSGGSSSDASSGFSLRLTDAPFAEVESLEISFSEVHLRRTDGTWVVIPGEDLAATKIEIAGLQGTKSADLLDGVDVPVGDYDELRLIVEETGTIVLTAGGNVDLQIPSGSSSGLKVKGDFSVSEGQPTTLVIDFDLLRGLRKVGNPAAPRFQLSPVLRLVLGNAFGHARGTVDGNLLNAPGCSVGEHNSVYVFEGHDVTPNDITSRNNDVSPITTSKITLDTDSGFYIYEAAFLPAGDYTIAFTCNADQEDLMTDDDLNFFGTQNITILVNDTVFL